MKKLLLIICLATISTHLLSQKVLNYNKDGDKSKSVSEYLDISIQNTPSDKAPFGPTSLPGVMLGPVYNIIYSAIKNGLEKREKSFTASYSNSKEFSSEEFKHTGLKSLLINRYAINTLDDINNDHLMAAYELDFSPEANSLTIELKSILLKGAKARYLKDDNLSLTINIKATSITQSKTKDPDTKQEKLDSKSTDSEGTITIPIFKVTGNNQDLSSKSNVINKIKLNGISLSKSNSLRFAINITETNITRIDPSKIQTIVSNSGSDFQSILKAIFGVTDK